MNAPTYRFQGYDENGQIKATHIDSFISRSADHRYTYEGVTYPGVTTVLGMLDKSGPLMGWAARETATAAVRMAKRQDGQPYSALENLLLNVGEDGTIKALSSRSNWQRDEAAQLGTEIHALADLIVQGRTLPTMTETQQKRVEHYARWWEASGWTLRLSEAMVVYPGDDKAQGWGGTFDLLAYDRDGRTVIADVKTGKAIYREAVLQLAAYGMSRLVQPAEAQRVYPMPLPDRYVILHATADGVREVEVAVGTAERMAFLACLELHAWSESMKGKRL